MPTKTSSSENSRVSSPASIPEVTRSLTASSVDSRFTDADLFNDLGHNYKGIEKVSRLHDMNGNKLGIVRIDFKSVAACLQVLNDEYILIDGKKRSIRPYRPVICRRCQKEGHYASHCAEKPITEARLNELFAQQRQAFENMIKDFEAKWEPRIALAEATVRNQSSVKLAPLFNDVATACHQLNQQNIQTQRQLTALANRAQEAAKSFNQ